jgi:hypothetical protein
MTRSYSDNAAESFSFARNDSAFANAESISPAFTAWALLAAKQHGTRMPAIAKATQILMFWCGVELPFANWRGGFGALRGRD